MLWETVQLIGKSAAESFSTAALHTSSLTLRTLHVPLRSRATGKAAFCTCQAGHGKSFKQCQCTGSCTPDMGHLTSAGPMPEQRCARNLHTQDTIASPMLMSGSSATHLLAPPAPKQQQRLQTVNEKSWLLAMTVQLLLVIGDMHV